MLKSLAKLVTRRPKMIVALWLIALVVALPLAGLVGGAMEYDDTKMGTNALESVQGMEYSSANFPGIERQGTTTIVINGADLLGDGARSQVLNMTSRLGSELQAKGIDVQVGSIYSSLAQYSTAYLLQLRSTYDAVNATLVGQGEPATISLLAQTITAQQANIAAWVVRAVAEPASFGTQEAAAMAGSLVSNSSTLAFPVPISTDLLTNMVNLPTADTMIITLTYPNGDASTGRDLIPLVREIVHSSIIDTTSLKVYVTGADAYYFDNTAGTEKDMAIIEPLTIVLIIVLIGISFRSFVASSMPPVVIGFALMISFAMLYLVGTYLFSVHYSTLMLMLTSMMGAGCDYCIFILSRYREERHSGKEKREAIGTSVEFAGESILTSGLTVMIGFGVLILASLNMLRSWSVLAIGIGIALLVALTLLPALLMLLGDRMFWPTKMSSAIKPRTGKKGYFARTARFAIKRAKVIVLAAIIISIPAVYLVIEMDPSYDMIASMPNNESKQGIVALGDAFGEGRVLPTYVMLNMSDVVSTGGVLDQGSMNAIENVSSAIASLGNIKQVISPTRPNGEAVPIAYGNLSSYPVDRSAQYAAQIRSMVGEDGRAVRITVIFDDGPYTSRSIGSVEEIRSTLAPFHDTTEITAFYVTGNSALVLDIVSMTQADFQVIEVVAIVLIYFVLMVVLGSVINPLRSIVTILISICWTMALMVVVFEMILNIPILWSIPIILLVVCLGLGMDYDILLTTRIREEASNGLSDQEAIVRSVERTGGIITACGIIMASAFATMMLSSNTVLMEMGFALSFAILLDATVVRMYLVPAIMSLLGRWNWWAPRRLQRVRRDHTTMEASAAIDAFDVAVEGGEHGTAGRDRR
jgi:putative drug exporter of the RND superfamily